MSPGYRGVVTVVLGLLAGCGRPSPPPPAPAPPPSTLEVADQVPAREEVPSFVAPLPEPPATTPAVPAYEVADDLSNVANLADFAFLDPPQRAMLAAQGFCATPAPEGPFEAAYLRNYDQEIAGLVTADAVLYAFDSLADQTAAQLAAESYPALLTSLVMALFERTGEQVAQAPSGELKDAARRNQARLGAAARMLGMEVQLEAPADPSPDEAAGATDVIDWLAEPIAARDTENGEWPHADLRELLLMLHALGAEPGAPYRHWAAVAESWAWFAGRPDSLTAGDALAAADEVFGAERRLHAYTDATRLAAFAAALDARGDRVALFGPPAEPIREAQGRLTRARREGTADLVEVLATLGQPRARELVDAARLPQRNPDYRAAAERLTSRFDALDEADWRRDLRLGRLWAAGPCSAAPAEGEPAFRRAPAWADKSLLTVLAAADSDRSAVTPAGEVPAPAAATPAETPPAGYVEPLPEVYARLGYLARATTAGLRAHGLLTPRDEGAWSAFADLADYCVQTSLDELANRSLTAEQRDRIYYFGRELAWLLGGAAAGEPPVLVLYVVIPHDGKLYLARGAMLAWQPPEPPGGLPAWCASFVLPNRFAPR